MASRRLLLKAARLLDAHAEQMRDGCEGGEPLSDWACGNCPCRLPDGRCEVSLRHAELVGTAKKLREAA